MRHTLTAAAVLALLSAPALAGDFHSGATLNCSDCHTMHFSQQHGFGAGGSGNWSAPIGTVPQIYLLKGPINDLCLSCHDGQAFAPDVLEAETGGAAGVPRNAGALNRAGANGYEATDGHTLDSTDDAPGSDPAWSGGDDGKLTCTDCHSQHGRTGTNGANLYKNLNAAVGNVTVWGTLDVTYLTQATAPTQGTYTEDVWQRQAKAYHESTIDWLEPDNTTSAIAAWCGGCHNNFHGDPGTGSNVGGTGGAGAWKEFIRHPVSGVDIGDIGGGHSNLNMYIYGRRTSTGTGTKANWVKVMSESATYTTAQAGDATPTCITCHKAHGNKNAFGLIWRSGTGLLTEEGDADGADTYSSLCGQCHSQAAAFAVP